MEIHGFAIGPMFFFYKSIPAGEIGGWWGNTEMALRLWGCCITIFYSQNMEITCYFFFSWLKMTWMVSSQQTLPSILAKPTCSSYFASFDVTSGQFKTEKKIEPTKSTRDEKRTHMWQKERTNNVFLFVSHVEQKERFPCSMVFHVGIDEIVLLSCLGCISRGIKLGPRRKGISLRRQAKFKQWVSQWGIPNFYRGGQMEVPATNIIGGVSSHVCLITRRYIYILYILYIYTLWVYISVFDTSYIMLV